MFIPSPFNRPFLSCKDPATTKIYTLSLHDALPICMLPLGSTLPNYTVTGLLLLTRTTSTAVPPPDRKSTRLNSSHGYISYAVFCLKKKNHDEFISPVIAYYVYHVNIPTACIIMV